MNLNTILGEFINIGGPEVIFIFLIALLLFGGKKLPELARGLGKGIREFKDASEGVKREIHKNLNEVVEKSEIVEANKDILAKKIPMDQQIVNEIQAAKAAQNTSSTDISSTIQ